MRSNLTYRIRNWPDYNRSLIARGNLTIWFSEEMPTLWYAKARSERSRGRPYTYSERCVEVALTLRSLFHFLLRTTQGFIEGLFQWLNLGLRVPHYTQLCRRASNKSSVLFNSKQG